MPVYIHIENAHMMCVCSLHTSAYMLAHDEQCMARPRAVNQQWALSAVPEARQRRRTNRYIADKALNTGNSLLTYG